MLRGAEPTRLDLVEQEISRLELLSDEYVDGSLINNVLQRLPRLDYLSILIVERDALRAGAAEGKFPPSSGANAAHGALIGLGLLLCGVCVPSFA
jgi:hypothetical protein